MSRAPALLLVCLAAGGCSYTFDDEAPTVTLVGAAPDMSAFRRYNRAPVQDFSYMIGVDNAYWLTIREQGNVFHSIRLAQPERELFLEHADDIIPRFLAFYLFTPSTTAAPTRLEILRPGQARDGPLPTFLLPPGPRFLLVNDGGGDDVFVYWIARPTTKSYTIYHLDRRFERTLPIPDGVAPESPYGKGSYLFSTDGSRFVVRDGKGKVTVYSTVSLTDVDLGVIPARFFLDERHQALITYDDKVGIRSVPLKGGAGREIAPPPIVPDVLWYTGKYLYYLVGEELRQVSLDQPAPPVVVQRGLRRVLGIDESLSRIYYGRDEPGRFRSGAGDGWLGDWNFMERGRDIHLAPDKQHLRWLEHAANPSGVGDLFTAPLPAPGAPAPTPVRLMRNVYQYGDLPDGRILAAANHAFVGTQNRIVTIDESTRTARWVANAARSYHYLPGSSDLLVDVVTGATGYDLVRVPLPPKP